jgi:hypothetical protein
MGGSRSMHLEERLLNQIVRATGIARELGHVRFQILGKRVVQSVECFDASGLVLGHQAHQCRIFGRALVSVLHHSRTGKRYPQQHTGNMPVRRVW